MSHVELSMEDFLKLQQLATSGGGGDCSNCPHIKNPTPASKPRRKKSAYNRKYAAAFKKVEKQYKKKAGGWKKNGFKNAQKAAHKLARR